MISPAFPTAFDQVMVLVAAGGVVLLIWLLASRRRLRAIAAEREQRDLEGRMRDVAGDLEGKPAPRRRQSRSNPAGRKSEP